MADIQKQFKEFHDEIKLKRFTENKTLREKRDIITDKINDGIKDKFGDDAPTLEFFDQGSYALDLGIKPAGGDYDIDEGVIFDLYKEDYVDPTSAKKWIRDIMEGHTSTPPNIKNPCVTITYSIDEDSVYHVDLPVYFNSLYDSKLYLAWGKEYASSENKSWELSDPKGLIEHVKYRFSGEDKKQFKRVVRYLKKWKDNCFSTSGNEMPPSIGITVAACEKFEPYKEYNYLSGKESYNDLESLIRFTNTFIGLFSLVLDDGEFKRSIALDLPVEPYSNIFEKMTIKQMDNFYNKLSALNTALQEAQEDPDPHTACKILENHFGSKFPIPASAEARYKADKSNAPSSNSAKG